MLLKKFIRKDYSLQFPYIKFTTDINNFTINFIGIVNVWKFIFIGIIAHFPYFVVFFSTKISLIICMLYFATALL